MVIEAKALSEPESQLLRLDVTAFPQRKAGQSKIKLNLAFTDAHTLAVTIEDLGLGQVSPGSGKVIQEIFHLE